MGGISPAGRKTAQLTRRANVGTESRPRERTHDERWGSEQRGRESERPEVEGKVKPSPDTKANRANIIPHPSTTIIKCKSSFNPQATTHSRPQILTFLLHNNQSKKYISQHTIKFPQNATCHLFPPPDSKSHSHSHCHCHHALTPPQCTHSNSTTAERQNTPFKQAKKEKEKNR